MPRPTHKSTRLPLATRDILSRCLLAAGIAASALAVGAVHTATLCVITAVLGAAALIAWWRAEPMAPRSAATVLLFTGIGLTAYTALQCVPMPITWLQAIAPHNADVWERALVPLHEDGPSWVPLSLDPIATRIEVLKGVAYLLAFLTALRVAARREGVRFLSIVLALTALTLGTAALLHPAFGATKLFGIYQPGPGISERHIAPLMNPNHLAAYINIGICMSLTGCLVSEALVFRTIASAVFLILGAIQVWVASRGGLLAMVLEILLLAVGMRIAKQDAQWRRARVILFSGGAALLAISLVVVALSQEARRDILDSNLSKFTLFAQALTMLEHHGLFGVGRGAFESTFPHFRREISDPVLSGYVTFTHPENILVQWLVEWGVVVAPAAIVACVLALRPGTALARSTFALGSWVAIAANVFHNLGDFSSEVPGVMLAIATCAGIVTGGAAAPRTRGLGQVWARRSTSVALVASAAAIAAITIAAASVGREVGVEREALYDAAIANPASLDEFRALERRAILRHPAEPYFPFIAGLRAEHEHDPGALDWIAATLERAQVYGPAHLVLARIVARRSPSQARLEYRLAMEQDADLVSIATSEAAPLIHGYWDATEVVPKNDTAILVLERLGALLSKRLPATVVELDADLAKRSPSSPGPLVRAARAAVEDIEAPAPWCRDATRGACLELASEMSRRLEAQQPRLCDGYELRARLAVATGDSARGLRDFEDSMSQVADRVGCLKQLGLLAQHVHDDARFEGALSGIANAGCVEDSECAKNLSWVAKRELDAGNVGRALAAYRRAYERDPDSDALLARIADLAASEGLHVEAAQDYERLARKHPESSLWANRATAEKHALRMIAAPEH